MVQPFLFLFKMTIFSINAQLFLLSNSVRCYQSFPKLNNPSHSVLYLSTGTFILKKTCTERENERERERKRQRQRQRQRQRGTETGTKTETERDRERQRDRETERHRETERVCPLYRVFL